MGRKSWGFYFGWLCILATVLVTSPGRAQNQPSGQGCNTASSNVAAAGIVQATGESLQRKRWQPQGGIIQFAVKSSARIPENASFLVCFRWRTIPENTEKFDERRPDRLDSNNDRTIWTVTTRIPDNLAKVPPGKVRETALPYVPLVPLADVRIIAVKEDMTLAADVTTIIGITYPLAAIFLAVATIVIALVTLTIITHLRLKHEGIKSAFWLLRIISTTGGYASLSQLQILLWTLVVAASAVYVMALSGDLIEITNGTLVLLGIAGAAALGAKVHTESQNSAAQTAAAVARKEADKATIEAAQKAAAPSAVAAEIDVAEKAKIDAIKIAEAASARANAVYNPPDSQTPQWSDLLVNETRLVDGTVTREIDVARFQMLLFTLITAVFVLLSVLTTYAIPEIPTGFLTLMGISNGVYLGAKVAQGS